MFLSRVQWLNGVTIGPEPSTTAVRMKKLLLDFSLKSADCTTFTTFGPILTCNHEKRLVKPLGGNLDGMNVWRTQYLWFSKCTLVLWSHCLSLPLNKTDTVWGRFFTLALSTCVACQMKMQLLPCLLVSLTCMLYIFETKQKKLKWGRGKYASSIVVKVKGILWINQLIKRWDM